MNCFLSLTLLFPRMQYAVRNARLIKRKPRPSHRKLHTTEQAFCGLMEELMLAAYPWVRIDAEFCRRAKL